MTVSVCVSFQKLIFQFRLSLLRKLVAVRVTLEQKLEPWPGLRLLKRRSMLGRSPVPMHFSTWLLLSSRMCVRLGVRCISIFLMSILRHNSVLRRAGLGG